MKLKYIFWGIGSVIVYGLLYYLLIHARYLYIDMYQYVTISDFDEVTLAFLHVSFGFMVIMGLCFGAIALFKKDWLHNRMLHGFILLPTYPALVRLFGILYEVLLKEDSIRHFSAGSILVLKYNEMYPVQMTHEDIVAVGMKMSYGGGLFLAILLFMAVIVNIWAVYFVYHRKFIKDYY